MQKHLTTGEMWINMKTKNTYVHYRQTSNISRTLVCIQIVDHSDVVGASLVGAAPTKS